jgi:hypothetical protein
LPRNPRRIRQVIVLLPIVAAVAVTVALLRPRTVGPLPDGDTGAAGPGGLEFAVLGDTPYSPAEEGLFEDLISQVNRARPSVVLHIGDIKAGSAPCDDAAYTRNLRRFNAFEAPLVYTPGDNDWADCARSGADPIERLAKLRQVFYPDAASLGRRRITLIRQSRFPENVRFRQGRVTFVAVHAVGGRNHRTHPEFPARDAAGVAWLSEGFRAATADRSAAVVVFMQADPLFGQPPEEREGFNALLDVLAAESARWDKPVLIAHGDTHTFRVDRPLVDRAGTSISNVLRVETFGSPVVGWAQVSFDASRPEPFSARGRTVGTGLRAG